MLPVNRYLVFNIGVELITKNRIAVRRASPFITLSSIVINVCCKKSGQP
jgi:hypothetical protein